MSTCLSHLGDYRNPALFAGPDNEDDVFDFARLLEEQHGPATAPGDDLDSFLEWIQDRGQDDKDQSARAD
jgi:hypothetical protein